MRRFAPAVSLFLLSPLVAEFLLGNLPITLLGALVALAPMYGGGALLIRETARRAGLGWPSILLLALGYGLVEEGLVTQSLFNPNYAGQHLLRPGFVPVLGIGAPWTVFVLTLHVVWSVATPIALVESISRRPTAPWLGRRGFIVVGVLLAVGLAANVAFTLGMDSYVAPWPRLAAVVVLVIGLVAAVLRAGHRGRDRRPVERVDGARHRAPSALVVGVLALLAGSAFQITAWLPDLNGWGTTAILVALLALAAAVVRVWSARPGWTGGHLLALAIGALATYAWHAFVEHPVVSATPAVDRTGDLVFGLGAALLAVLAVRRQASSRRAEPGAAEARSLTWDQGRPAARAARSTRSR